MVIISSNGVFGRTFAHRIKLTYMRFSNTVEPVRIGVQVIIAAQLAATPQCPTAVGTFKIGTWNYVFSRNASSHFCLLSQGASLAFYSTVDIMDVGRFLSKQGFFRGSDRLQIIQHESILYGRGQFILKEFLYVNSSTYTYTNQTCRYLGHLFVCNILTSPNYYSFDYSNVSVPLIVNSVTGVVADFKFIDQNRLNSFIFVPLGYFNTSLLMYEPSFPMNSLTQRHQLWVNFSFTTKNLSVNAEWAACAAVILRKDINTATGNFTTSQLHPAAEVLICPWWKIVSTSKGTLIHQNINLFNLTYNIYSQTDHNVDNNASWPTFVFTPSQASTTNINLDVIPFLRKINRFYLLKGFYITGVHTGFRQHFGQAQSTFINFSYSILPKTPIRKDIFNQLCLFGLLNSNTQSCQPDPDLYKFTLALMSIPNIALMLRYSPMIGLVDQLAYFSYHEARYDITTDYIIDLCWNLTNQKWVPFFISGVYTQFLSILDHTSVQKNPDTNLSQKVKRKGETLFFINNAQDFLFVAMPITIGSWILLRMFYYFCEKRNWKKMTKLLKPLRSPSYILVSITAENVQYLSFRCFQQLTFARPVFGQLILSYASLIIAPLVLFIILAGSLCLFPMIWKFDRHNFEFQESRQQLRTYLLYSVILFSRFLNGFFHAWMYNPAIQLSGLLMSSIIPLVIIFRSRKTFKNKTGFMSSIYIYIMKTLLIVELLIETQIGQDWIFISDLQLIFGKLSSVFICVWMCFLIFSFLNIWIRVFYNIFKKLPLLLPNKDSTDQIVIVKISNSLWKNPKKYKSATKKKVKTFANVRFNEPNPKHNRNTAPSTKCQVTIKPSRFNKTNRTLALSLSSKSVTRKRF